MNTSVKPSPQITELSRPYWEAAAQGRLTLQCCSSCQKVRHYPQLLCSHCYSDSVVWTPASGHGSVHSWTVAHHAFHPAFAADLPYTLVTVDLEEGVRALGRWRSGDTPSIGQPVLGHFEAREGGVDLIFEPLAD
ncbi:MAG: OB-fold domain-containing protein [Burkholderiaceae bacterium]|nr:OB-fold domain-containing protein [Burkholderiaceae bacterium]